MAGGAVKRQAEESVERRGAGWNAHLFGGGQSPPGYRKTNAQKHFCVDGYRATT
jgi:hypothetical protein